MLGPLGRPGLSAPRRPRRRIVLVVVLAVLVLGLVVGEISYQVVQSGGAATRRDTLTWDAEAAAIAEQSAVLAQQVHALRGDARSVSASRLTLEASLAALEQATAAQRAAMAAIALPAPAGPIAGELETVLAGRAAGARELATGIGEAIGAAGPTGAAVALQAAGVDFEQADVAYARFLRLLPRQVDPAGSSATQWIAEPEAWSTASVHRWAAALAVSPALRARRSLQLLDVSLRPPPVSIIGLPTTTTTTTSTSTTSTTTTTLPGATTTTLHPGARTARHKPLPTTTSSTTTTIPAPTTTLQIPPAGSVSILPPTASIAVVAVVRNNGDVADDDVTVAATLSPVGPGAATSGGGAASAVVASLAPGSARYLRLHPVRAGNGRYVLVVTANATGAAAQSARIVLDVRG